MAAETEERAYGKLAPTPKYETPQDELPAQDPNKGAKPGTPEAASVAQPESPHLGKEYEPGSANTVAPKDAPENF